MEKAAIPLFYSYSHKDEAFRDTLETHLAILKRQGFIDTWHDRRIVPGGNWEEEINLNLQNAKIVLLLVSSNFLASDYCYDTETIFALEQHSRNECIVVPIILKPCLWTKSHFRHLQALPKDGKPITTWANEDEAWLDVAEGMLALVENIRVSSKKFTIGSINDIGSLHMGNKHIKAEFYSEGGSINISGSNRTKYSDNSSNGNDSEVPINIDDGIDEGVKPGGEIQVSLEKEIYRFLKTYNNWYFSPLRIQKWGGSQVGFESLSNFDTYSIKVELENLTKMGKLKTAKNQKGNIIYKPN